MNGIYPCDIDLCYRCGDGFLVIGESKLEGYHIKGKQEDALTSIVDGHECGGILLEIHHKSRVQDGNSRVNIAECIVSREYQRGRWKECGCNVLDRLKQLQDEHGKEDNMNIVAITGNLTDAPKISYTQSGKAVAHFDIAENFGERVNYHHIVAWDKLAERCNEHLSKGSKVGVTGRLDYNSFTNKEGAKVKYAEIVASNVEFLSPKQRKEESREERPPYDEGDDYGLF